MSQTLRELCDAALEEAGFSTSQAYANAMDETGKQVFRLALREGHALARGYRGHRWQALMKTYPVTLAAGAQTYALPADYAYMVPNTLWDRGNKRIGIGPLSGQEWQFLKGWTTVQGLNRRFRIRGGQLEFEQPITAAEAGSAVHFEYVSNYWARDSTQVAKRAFTTDTDEHVFDDDLFALGVLWRFKKAKGFDWELDYQEYATELTKLMARDGGERVIRFGEPAFGAYLGVNVPDRQYG